MSNIKGFEPTRAKRQVLVADDELVNREILGNLLQDDFEVLFAADGKAAIDLIVEHRETLSLVLLDLMMPVMSGIDVLKHAKADPETSQIPIIVLTADAQAEVESLTIGAIDFIPKPYPQKDVILARMWRIIELSEDRQIIDSTERDALTGLYTKEYFYRYADKLDKLHKDVGADAIVVDVNHFHMINERLGTAYGDDLLRHIGASLKSLVIDQGGIVCRKEADTFLVYCPHLDDYDAFLEKASVGLEGSGEASHVWLRMGVYSDSDKSLAVERRFDRAKMAADTVHGSFMRRICVYDEDLREKELFAEQLIEDFPTALKEGQFKVHYQPKFDIRPDIPVLASAEALIRWQHPKLGLISPAAFIPLFEENGLIQRLDLYVWQQAAAQIREWKERIGYVVPVSVNASRIDMFDPRLVESLLEVLEHNEIGTDELLIEITESAYTQDSKQIVETVNTLRGLGFKIEMDDFGTGYSSLNMISALPIDALKLDMQFIRTAFSEQRDTKMVEIIIDIADYLGVPVIAEGVETEEQMLALREMGCDYVQGYYFSRPVPAEEYEKFVIERKEQDASCIVDAPAEEGAAPSPRGASSEAEAALSSGFDAIFYIDVDNGSYIKFSANGSSEDLQVESTGPDFFADMESHMRATACDEDRERAIRALRKDTLLAAIVEDGPFYMTYRARVDGTVVFRNLKAVMARTRDDHHLILGTGNAENRIRDREAHKKAVEKALELES